MNELYTISVINLSHAKFEMDEKNMYHIFNFSHNA
jgi:hypothetical protein